MTKKLFLILLAIALAFSFGLVACGGGEEEEEEEEEEEPFGIDFYQIDFDLDGDIITDSSWGAATIVYESDEEIEFINLAINGQWVVQNLPFLPVGTEFTLDFDLGVENGIDVTQLPYACEITTYLLETMPSDFQTATVADRSAVMYSGEIGASATFSIPGALIGWLPVDFAWHSKDDIVNQPCGVGECVPAAVSNSLKLLKKKHNLDMKDNDISIDKMKEATDWNPGGAPVGWWDTKKKYMEGNLPIETTVYGKNDLDTIIGEIRRGQDVEVGADSHRAMVVGIIKLANGKYVLLVAHDTNQGPSDNGGEEIQLTIYDPETEKFTGGKWFNGNKLINFVVECPGTPKPPDASIEFDTWTINGQPVPPGTYEVPPSTIIDIRYKVHVDGQPGAVVTVQETSWLNIHYVSGEEPSIWLHAVNAPGAVSMDPPATKVHQMTTVEGEPAPYCTYTSLLKCVPVNLDVQTEWPLVVCTDYAKTINWLHIGQVTDEEVLFDLQALPGQSYTLYSYSSVELEGDENAENNDTGWCPLLTIVIVPPP
jgi:hypothetical protein